MFSQSTGVQTVSGANIFFSQHSNVWFPLIDTFPAALANNPACICMKNKLNKMLLCCSKWATRSINWRRRWRFSVNKLSVGIAFAIRLGKEDTNLWMKLTLWRSNVAFCTFHTYKLATWCKQGRLCETSLQPFSGVSGRRTTSTLLITAKVVTTLKSALSIPFPSIENLHCHKSILYIKITLLHVMCAATVICIKWAQKSAMSTGGANPLVQDLKLLLEEPSSFSPSDHTTGDVDKVFP